MGGDRQEVKGHWCKVCWKNFPCGRSLGGHMRSHLSLSSPAPEAEERPARSSRSCITDSGIGYGLRENPKKTWRLSEPAGGAKKHEVLCKDCGKGFPTLKSLYGHMRCHSEKLHCKMEEDAAEEMGREQGVENKGALLEKELENEVLVPRKKKRSRRVTSISGSSSSGSDIDKEQEDAALTLMILSRGADRRSCINSVVETPDLNSVFLEAKGALKCWKENSECQIQYDSNGMKNSEFDVSCPAFIKLEAHVDDSDEIEHSLEASRNSSETKSLNFTKEDMFPEVYDTKLSYEQVNIVSDGDMHKSPKKNSLYECSVCNETFRSYQSFSGHRASHIRMKGCTRTRSEGNKKKKMNNVYSEPKIIGKIIYKNVSIGSSSGPSKKVNKHQCPILSKVFS